MLYMKHSAEYSFIHQAVGFIEMQEYSGAIVILVVWTIKHNNCIFFVHER